MASQNNRTGLEQVTAMLRSIPLRRLILIGSAALALGAAIFGFAYWRKNSDFRPLYRALSPEDAGSIVTRLKEKGVAYRLSEDGSSISVPEKQLAETRLEMASAGLPKTGRIGFELFDQTKFGATDFMEHINYRRALEGELERTLDAMSEVEQARVHLTFTKDSVFTENRLPAKASVVLKLRSSMPQPSVRGPLHGRKRGGRAQSRSRFRHGYARKPIRTPEGKERCGWRRCLGRHVGISAQHRKGPRGQGELDP